MTSNARPREKFTPSPESTLTTEVVEAATVLYSVAPSLSSPNVALSNSPVSGAVPATPDAFRYVVTEAVGFSAPRIDLEAPIEALNSSLVKVSTAGDIEASC